MTDAAPSEAPNARPNTTESITVDPKEHQKFHQLADSWWDKSGPFWPLHTLNALRVEWIQAQLGIAKAQVESPLKGLMVLDIGCGGGILSESLARLGASVTGIDVVEKNIHVARLHAAKENLDIEYECVTVEAMTLQSRQFDIVFNMEVVEHVAELETFLRASQALVKPEGSIFISTINRNILAFMIAIIGAEYILGWLPKGTHRYSLLRKPSEIENVLAQDNFVIKKTVGVAVNPFNKKMRLSANRLVNYMLHAVRKSSSEQAA